jgi:hypothetical protein
VYLDAGYTGVEKREELKEREVDWQVAMKRGKLKAVPEDRVLGQLLRKLESVKGQHSVQGGTSLPHRQEPVPLQEGALQGLGQEHGAASHPVRLGQPGHCQAATVGAQQPSCVLRNEEGLETGRQR